LARYASTQREEAYRYYVTDGFYLQGQGKAFGERFCNLIKPKDNRSGDEIAADVIERLNLRVNE
jgi:hypothetical protein